MTTLTLPAQARPGTKPVPWRQMVWVTWRQHRATLISVPALFGAVAVFLWIAGLKIHHDYAVLTACRPLTSSACQNLNTAFNRTDWTIAHTVELLLNVVPALIGAFAGGPVLAREVETGTFRFAWTQGFGRARWTIAKLTLLGVAITAVAGAFTQVFTWFFQPFLAQESMTVLTDTVFVTRGVLLAAWTLTAFVIGAFLGMLIRRTVPAIAVTVGVYLGLSTLAWQVLRRHYPVTMVTANPNIGSGIFNVNWPTIISTWTTGHTRWTRYVPVSRFWPMQFAEAGWLLALSVLLTAATVWLVRHRAA